MTSILRRSLKLPFNQHLFLFGPRQVGKSTLLKETFAKSTSLYIDLLLPDNYRRYVKKPELLIEEVLVLSPEITHVIIDEVQRVPELLNAVHYLIENDDTSVHFVLSGSSARKLKRGQANLLAGRALSYSLYPLTHFELGNEFDLKKVLDRGSLPAIYFEQDRAIAQKKLQTYCKTYLQEEIRAESLLRNLSAFITFLDFVAEENGHEINYSNIAGDIGTSSHTVKDYFQILEDTLLGFTLPAFSKSVRKTLSKRPKFYLFDLGVTKAIANKLALSSVEGSASFGESFEHFIIREIHTLVDNLETDFSLSYYRTRSGQEVDLILESPSQGIFAIEIKAKDANLKSKDLRGLKSFAEEYPDAKLFCCSLSPRRRLQDGILILPWKELFAEIGLQP